MRKALALGLPLIFLATACTYDNGDSHRVLYDNGGYDNGSCGTPSTSISTIDADQQIAVDPGLGAGLFVEYGSGGHYRVSVACDTLRTNASCDWDAIITPQDGATITNVLADGLSGSDGVHFLPGSGNQPDAYQLVTHTTTEVEGFSFDIEPGSAIAVDALLDGSCAQQYFYWFGDGALHQGASGNPLSLTPSSD